MSESSSSPGSMLSGALFWLKGAKLVLGERRLWKYLVFPVMINFVVITLLCALGVNLAYDFLPDIVYPGTEGAWWHWMFWWQLLKSTGYFLFSFLVWALTWILLGVVFVVLFVVLASITGSPFYDHMSFKIEELQGLSIDERPFSVRHDVITPMGYALKMAGFQGGVCLVAFPLNGIPVAGGVAYVFVVSLPLTISLIAYSFERRFTPFRSQLRHAWQHRSVYIGFGLAAMLSMIPFGLGIITFPLSVAGATLLFIEHQEKSAA